MIIDGYKKADSESLIAIADGLEEGQTVYLVALAALISMIPTSLCISELSSVGPGSSHVIDLSFCLYSSVPCHFPTQTFGRTSWRRWDP